MSNHSHRSWQLPFGSQPALELRADATSVAIVPVGADETPHLEAIGRGADRLDLRIDRVGDRVNVAIEPFRQFTWWGGWDTRLVLHVPPTVSARVETSAGSIDVRQLDGCDLELKASAGRIELNNVRGRLKLAADAGSIRGHDVAGRIWAETQAGSIRLEVTGLEPGEHRVRASMGQVRVDIAQGLEVKVESRASMGSSRVSYPSHPNASAVLQLSTEMGAIRVGEGMPAAARSARDDGGPTNGHPDVPGGVPPVPPVPPRAAGWPWAPTPPPGAPPGPARRRPPRPPAGNRPPPLPPLTLPRAPRRAARRPPRRPLARPRHLARWPAQRRLGKALRTMRRRPNERRRTIRPGLLAASRLLPALPPPLALRPPAPPPPSPGRLRRQRAAPPARPAQGRRPRSRLAPPPRCPAQRRPKRPDPLPRHPRPHPLHRRPAPARRRPGQLRRQQPTRPRRRLRARPARNRTVPQARRPPSTAAASRTAQRHPPGRHLRRHRAPSPARLRPPVIRPNGRRRPVPSPAQLYPEMPRPGPRLPATPTTDRLSPLVLLRRPRLRPLRRQSTRRRRCPRLGWGRPRPGQPHRIRGRRRRRPGRELPPRGRPALRPKALRRLAGASRQGSRAGRRRRPRRRPRRPPFLGRGLRRNRAPGRRMST